MLKCCFLLMFNSIMSLIVYMVSVIYLVTILLVETLLLTISKLLFIKRNLKTFKMVGKCSLFRRIVKHVEVLAIGSVSEEVEGTTVGWLSAAFQQLGHTRTIRFCVVWFKGFMESVHFFLHLVWFEWC